MLSHSSALHQDRLDVSVARRSNWYPCQVRSWQRTGWHHSTGPNWDAPPEFIPLMSAPQQFFPNCKKQTTSMRIFGLIRSLPKIPGPSDHSVHALLPFDQVGKLSGLSAVDRHSVQQIHRPGAQVGILASSLLRRRLRRLERPLLLVGFAESHQGCRIVTFLRRTPGRGSSYVRQVQQKRKPGKVGEKGRLIDKPQRGGCGNRSPVGQNSGAGAKPL